MNHVSNHSMSVLDETRLVETISWHDTISQFLFIQNLSMSKKETLSTILKKIIMYVVKLFKVAIVAYIISLTTLI